MNGLISLSVAVVIDDIVDGAVHDIFTPAGSDVVDNYGGTAVAAGLPQGGAELPCSFGAEIDAVNIGMRSQ